MEENLFYKLYMLLQKKTCFSCRESKVRNKFYFHRFINLLCVVCLWFCLLCSNLWALGKSWLHDDMIAEKYFESQNAILAEVHDKESADSAAERLKKLRLLPEYADLEHDTPSLFNPFCDHTERERISKALFFGSTDLAKALCGEQYKFYLLEEKEPAEEVNAAIAEHLFSEMGNITGGGPGFSAETAWKVDEFRVMSEGGLPLTADNLWKADEFRDIIPYQDNLELLPESLLPDSVAHVSKVQIEGEKIYVEYGLKLISNRNVYTISQWYVSLCVRTENKFPEKEDTIDEETVPYGRYLLLFNSLLFLLDICLYIRAQSFT